MKRLATLFSILIAILSLALQSSYAQLTGTKNIPGDYADIAAAITDLNTQGVGSGGVTFNVAAGYTETLTAPLALTATGTAANPIVFQKSGAGANPLITAYVGTQTPGSATHDDMWRLVGSDYVTIDGIDLTDPNTTNPATMEGGYVLYKASASDGAQNNTIKNCVITLSRNNNASGSGPSVEGSRGIEVTNATPAAATTALTPTDANGTNSNNRFYSNTIQNCNYGIVLSGYAAASPFTLGDTGNDIGGSSSATGNTILNFGGATGATNPSAGIRANNQWSVNISYNTINNNNGSGVNHPSTLRGIYAQAGTSANATINNNTITIHGGATTSTVVGIENGIGSTAASNTVEIANNNITGDYLTATSGAFYLIYNIASPTTINITGNNIHDITYSAAALSGTGTVYGIYSTGAATNVNVRSNIVNTISRTGTTGGTTKGIYVSGGTNQTVKLNTVSNLSIDGSGVNSIMYGIETSTGTIVCDSNTVNNLTVIKTSGTSALNGIYNFASPTNENYNYNQVYNVTHNGTGTTYGIYTFTTTGVRTVSNNLVHSISGAGTTVAGINQASSSPTIFKNKIYNVQSTSTGAPTVSGLILGSLGTSGVANVYNNLIGDIKAPNASTSAATSPTVRGINITTTTSSTSLNLSYNTVYLNASSTGTNFGTAALYVTSSATATTAALTLRNNVFVNVSTPAGTGLTVAYHRSGTDLANYASASNNNDFYAGTPGASNLIFYDGTNSDQTIAAYKTRVSPRDAASFSENPPFISTSGSSPNFLHISTSTATQLESGGQPITGITDDYDGDLRNASTPDVGADEFAGTGLDLSPPIITYTLLGNTSSTSNRSFTGVTITDASGVNGTAGTRPRVYYKRSTDGNVLNDNTSGTDGWKYAEASGSSSPFDFTIDYSLLNGGTGVSAGTIVQYFVVAQDLATTPNVGINSGTFAATPSSVALTSAAFPIGGTINSYTIATAFSGSYNVGTGETYTTLTGAGGFFSAINANLVTGNITVNIVSDITEDGTNALNQWTEEGAGNYSITIQPNAAIERLISAAFAGGMIRLSGADRVTFDGRFSGSGKFLRFRNTSTTGQTFVFLNDATNNTIRDCYVEGANTSTTSGTILFSTSTGTSGNSNNTIMNCDVRDRSDATGVPANAIYSSGTAGAPNANNTISGCNIFNWTNAGVLVSSTGAGNGWTVNPSSFYQTASRTSALIAISIQGGSGHTVSSNSIGGSAADRSGSPLTTTSTFTGITMAAGTASTSNIQGNVLANLNISGGSSQTFKGIQVTSGNVNVGTTTGNVIGSTSDTPGSDTVRVSYDSDIIENTGSGTVTIANNTIRHVAYYRNSNDRLLGIGSSSGTVTISNNTIRNLSSNASASTSFFLMGLRVTGGTSATVSGNTIRNLTQTNTGSGAFWVSGINVSTITSATFEKNSITEINADGTGTGASAPIVRGIHSTSGSATFVNNMVSVGGASAGDVIVRGIESLGTGSNKFYFNSVLVGGADGGTGTNKTFAFYRSSTAADTLRNNILSNQRTVGTGTHFAIGNSSTTSWGANTSNYNDLIASVASTVGEWLTTAGTFADWQTNSGGDANSISYAVTFISATDLHLNASHNGDMNLKGTPAGGITVDFDNQTRDTQAPYIGADELSTPLPVQLVSFTARINQNGPGVRLDWRTISEINNFGFYVQRKRQGETAFTELQNSFVPGHGTTNEPHDYFYIDASITETGLYFYRLRQVDLDGTPHFTEPVTVNVTTLSVDEVAPKVFALFQNYPNPFNPSTQIKFSVENTARATLELYNTLGQKVATLFDELAEAGKYYRVNVNANHLATGMYIYRLQSGTRTDVKKMVLMK